MTVVFSGRIVTGFRFAYLFEIGGGHSSRSRTQFLCNTVICRDFDRSKRNINKIAIRGTRTCCQVLPKLRNPDAKRTRTGLWRLEKRRSTLEKTLSRTFTHFDCEELETRKGNPYTYFECNKRQRKPLASMTVDRYMYPKVADHTEFITYAL
jgi:hypothetical protein